MFENRSIYSGFLSYFFTYVSFSFTYQPDTLFKIPESPALSNFTNRKLDLLRRRYDTIQNLHVHFKLGKRQAGKY